jgi:hypothetical protein
VGYGNSVDPNTNWHLDKRIPIVTLFGLLAQAAAIVWFAATMSARLQSLETLSVAANQTKLTERISERMSVEEEKSRQFTATFSHIDQQLDRIEKKIDVQSARKSSQQ